MDINLIAQDILATLQRGWNSGSGSAFSEPFAGTCDFVTIRGELHQNASPHMLAEAHQGLFVSIYKGSKIVYSLIQAKAYAPDLIVVHAMSELDAPTGPLQGKNNSVISIILAKDADSWKIRSFHNTLVFPNRNL